MRALLSWSGGKDGAFALGELRARGEVEVAGLLTTVWEGARRVAIHGVREELLDAQAAAVGLPVVKVPLPYPCANETYEARTGETLAAAGVDAVAFGDLFLEDIRRYREALCARVGLEPLFPLWGRDTGALARAMIASGLKARLVCVDTRHLSRAFAGRAFDEALLADLPAGVDPCGERGEFHTFVHAGPPLAAPLPVEVDALDERDGFVFADLRLL
ncbi:MAG: ATP-binding protein [Planctomycetota bacterium]